MPITAIYEFVFVLLSKGKEIEKIIESLEIVSDIMNKYDIKILEFTFPQLIKGLEFYKNYKLGLFDCLIMGTAYAFKDFLIGDDKHFKMVKEIECKNYKTFLESI